MNTTNLARVQVYLDPQDVALLDTIATRKGVTRSKIIREAVRDKAKKYIRVKPKTKKNYLLELIGVGKSKISNLAMNVDEIYHHD